VFFGAAIFIMVKFFMGFLLKEQGLLRLIITLAIGFGMLVGAYFAAPICGPAAVILVVGAVIFGGFPIVLLFMFVGSIPVIGDALASAVSPISGMLMILLILAIVEFIVNILSIFSMIPIIGWIILVLNIVLPIIQLVLLWSVFSGAFADMTKCFNPVGTVIPGTGGISIGS
jgi:hypothetical protein